MFWPAFHRVVTLLGRTESNITENTRLIGALGLFDNDSHFRYKVVEVVGIADFTRHKSGTKPPSPKGIAKLPLFSRETLFRS